MVRHFYCAEHSAIINQSGENHQYNIIEDTSKYSIRIRDVSIMYRNSIIEYCAEAVHHLARIACHSVIRKI